MNCYSQLKYENYIHTEKNNTIRHIHLFSTEIKIPATSNFKMLSKFNKRSYVSRETKTKVKEHSSFYSIGVLLGVPGFLGYLLGVLRSFLRIKILRSLFSIGN